MRRPTRNGSSRSAIARSMAASSPAAMQWSAACRRWCRSICIFPAARRRPIEILKGLIALLDAQQRRRPVPGGLTRLSRPDKRPTARLLDPAIKAVAGDVAPARRSCLTAPTTPACRRAVTALGVGLRTAGRGRLCSSAARPPCACPTAASDRPSPPRPRNRGSGASSRTPR